MNKELTWWHRSTQKSFGYFIKAVGELFKSKVHKYTVSSSTIKKMLLNTCREQNNLNYNNISSVLYMHFERNEKTANA